MCCSTGSTMVKSRVLSCSLRYETLINYPLGWKSWVVLLVDLDMGKRLLLDCTMHAMSRSVQLILFGWPCVHC